MTVSEHTTIDPNASLDQLSDDDTLSLRADGLTDALIAVHLFRWRSLTVWDTRSGNASFVGIPFDQRELPVKNVDVPRFSRDLTSGFRVHQQMLSIGFSFGLWCTIPTSSVMNGYCAAFQSGVYPPDYLDCLMMPRGWAWLPEGTRRFLGRAFPNKIRGGYYAVAHDVELAICRAALLALKHRPNRPDWRG